MLDEIDVNRVIEMAWEDRTPFDAIEKLYGLREKDVIALMRRQLKSKTFKNWRARVTGRASKHGCSRNPNISRSHCPTQYKLKSK